MTVEFDGGDGDCTEDGGTSKITGAIGEVGETSGGDDEKADSEAAGNTRISLKSRSLGNSKSGGLSAGKVLICKRLRLWLIKRHLEAECSVNINGSEYSS